MAEPIEVRAERGEMATVAEALGEKAAATTDVDDAIGESDAVVIARGLRKVFLSAGRSEVRDPRRASRITRWLGLDRVAALLRGLIRPRLVVAVQGLDLEIAPGQVFGLLGPNGSGKSTTVKMLLGLVAPTGGTARVFGYPPEHIAVKRRIGFLPEETYLYRFLNADETLDFYGRLFNLPRKVRRERADRLIHMVGLDAARGRKLAEYSKGMARRLGLAQALINDPDLLILDEPTTGLDPIGVAEMKALLVELREQGKTILMCSHLLADVEEVCDRVAILCDGELLVEGAIADLLSYRDVLELQVDRSDAEFEKRLREFIEAEGAHVVASRNPSDSLSRLFLRLVDQKRPGAMDESLRVRLGLTPAEDDHASAGGRASSPPSVSEPEEADTSTSNSGPAPQLSAEADPQPKPATATKKKSTSSSSTTSKRKRKRKRKKKKAGGSGGSARGAGAES